MHFTLLKSVLQPYSVLLFSHVLISIFDVFEHFGQMYSPCVSFIWAQGEGAGGGTCDTCAAWDSYRWLLPVCFIILDWEFILSGVLSVKNSVLCSLNWDSVPLRTIFAFVSDRHHGNIISLRSLCWVLSLEIFKQLLSVNFKRANLFLIPPPPGLVQAKKIHVSSLLEGRFLMSTFPWWWLPFFERFLPHRYWDCLILLPGQSGVGLNLPLSFKALGLLNLRLTTFFL